MAEMNEDGPGYAGISVSAEALNAVLTTAKGEVLRSVNVRMEGSEGISAQISDFINALKDDLGPLESIGVAVPGLISKETGRVEFSARIPEHSQINLKAELESDTGLAILIENDANAAAFAEFIAGAGRGASDLFYLTLGDGVGGGLILNGKIWHGAYGFAGEVGYLLVNEEGIRLEEMASSPNIVRRTQNRFRQDSTSELSKLEEDQITIAAILDAAEKDDDLAKLMLERTGNYVGAAVAGVINLLNIEKVVIGGDIMQVGDHVLAAAIARAKELSFAPSFDRTSITAGELGGNAAAIGAAFLAGGL